MRRGIPRWVEAPAALVALVAASPVLLAAAAAVRLTSRGPALFRQARVGRGGRQFVLKKLRTMRVAEPGLQITAGDDERTTRVGRLLRKSKLDELPELWHVVVGDMSLVGPRPEVPRYVDLGDPRWRAILRDRPGLTDPTTLALRNEEALLARVDGDREDFYVRTLQPFKLDGYARYAERRTLASDLSVLARTVAAVVAPAATPAPSLDELRGRAGGRA